MIKLLEQKRFLRCAALLLIALVTVLIYAEGLHGPFLLDDVPNLETIQRWVQGRLDWHSAIDNRSGPLGRPVSMITFLIDAGRSGAMYPETFKTTNLVIHILCGWLVYLLSRQLFQRAETTRTIASSAALFVAAWWLFIPLHVSTVLYIVQRMAQLSALFILLALIIYMASRQAIDQKRSLLAHLGLWIVFPATVGIGALGKENAVLAIPLALLIELLFFCPQNTQPRPRSVLTFFILMVVIPSAVAAGWLVTHFGVITGGYQSRPFTLTERLLTEPRVLWSYVKTILLPVGEDMGLFHDNYVISTGWLKPWTTLLAILGWLAAIVAAIAYRWRHPLIAFGIGFYLIGHLLESTIVPLEIYFEHRNYLPDLGILIALVGFGRALWLSHPHATREFRRAVTLFPILTLTIYAVATWVQVGSWADADTLFEMQQSYNPTSPRLHSMLAARSVERGDTRGALAHIDLAEQFGPTDEGMNATIWRFIAYCSARKPVPETLYEEFEHRKDMPITLNSMRYWEQLALFTEKGCLDAKRMAVTGRIWIDHSSLAPESQLVWRSRYNLARIVATSGDLVQAEADARRAWVDSDYNTGIAVLLFQLNATLGRREACEAILARLRQQMNRGNADLVEAVRLFSKALAEGKVAPPSNPDHP